MDSLFEDVLNPAGEPEDVEESDSSSSSSDEEDEVDSDQAVESLSISRLIESQNAIDEPLEEGLEPLSNPPVKSAATKSLPPPLPLFSFTSSAASSLPPKWCVFYQCYSVLCLMRCII